MARRLKLSVLAWVALGACLPPVHSYVGYPCDLQHTCGDGLECRCGRCATDPVPAAGPTGWQALAPLAQARIGLALTVTCDGQPFVAGGHTGAEVTPSSEVYDLAADRWSSGPSLVEARYNATATALFDGEVAVIGGEHGPQVATVDRIDLPHRTMRPGKPMSVSRSGHSAVLLQSGAVLVIGGIHDSVPTASVELYDPIADAWADAGTLTSPRNDFATVVPKQGAWAGQVLVLGGTDGVAPPLSTVEAYDPSTGRWDMLPPMLHGRSSFGAAELADGRILAVGGYSGVTPVTLAEIYDPATRLWSNAEALPLPWGIVFFTLDTLRGGDVLLAGGSNLSPVPFASSERLAAGSHEWTDGGTLHVGRAFHFSATLPDGRLMVVGGLTDGGPSAPTPSVEAYTP